MEKLERITTHDGIVTAVKSSSVTVQIHSVSACASCAAHAKCGFAESKDKELEIPTQQRYNVGDHVTVCIDTSSGLRAVWIAYLLPAILIIAVVIVLSAASVPEGVVALAAFAVLALHILVLFILRHKIDRRFQITIEPNK
jgi:sigma-E factor negative regulatory protein RseC